MDLAALCRYSGGMKKITIRLDDELHARIEQAAGRDDRSLNGEVAWLLKAGLDASRSELPRCLASHPDHPTRMVCTRPAGHEGAHVWD